jgi:amino-acid N-acetyltransferase
MSDEFHVRTARLADAEGIYALIREHTIELVPRSLGNVVENIDRFLVAEGSDGALAGCVAYQVWPEIGDPLKATVELQSVAVRETCRRKGIGSMLVKGALARVRVLEPADVTVLTLTPEFFATLGFPRYRRRASCTSSTRAASTARSTPTRSPARKGLWRLR